MIEFGTPKKTKQANTKFSIALSEFDAAEKLFENELYRESVSHLYKCSFFLAQAICAETLRSNSSHKPVQTELNRLYGRGKREIAKRYVTLHNRLHELRNMVDYRSAWAPRSAEVKKSLRLLRAFVAAVDKHLVKVTMIDVIRGIRDSHPDQIRDLSYDVYCPRTYSHHNRVTFWQPPFYLDVFTAKSLIRHASKMLASLRVRNHANYVLGLNSRVDQYADKHLFMLDFDSLDTDVESALKSEGGVLFKTGRGYHFIGNRLINGRQAWVKKLRRFRRQKELQSRIDTDHIDLSIQRGYSTLRITCCPIKPQTPVFHKELP